ncbi:MAG: cytochrome c [Nitrospirae bacterium]|nr:cytochrome c [Nitrospirota bacterium]
MIKCKKGELIGIFVFLFFVTASIFVPSTTYATDDGKNLYEGRCLLCHGPLGDGKGLVKVLPHFYKFGKLYTTKPRDFTQKPRDFTNAVFKFRTTPSGCLPTDSDLAELIKNGIPKAYMPPNGDLNQSEISSIIKYIKTFSKIWEENPNDASCAPIAINKPDYVGTLESAAKGKQIWVKMKCADCHGEQGRGDGPKSGDIIDDWGNPILPFDFTSCAAKMTFKPESGYRAFSTGLSGSGMPSYSDSLSEEERWHLVSYTLMLMGKI